MRAACTSPSCSHCADISPSSPISGPVHYEKIHAAQPTSELAIWWQWWARNTATAKNDAAMYRALNLKFNVQYPFLIPF